MSILSSYRPHNPGHDYYDVGVYHITLVVGGRDNLLGRLNMDVRQPSVELTELGIYLRDQWQKTAELQAKRGNHIQLHAQVCMPDHWHGVIEVYNRMSWSLGDIIQAVKATCTSHWRKMTGYTESPISAQRVRHMSHENRRLYYASLPREQRPLFDDDYDDTICLNERHRCAMIHYVVDNPRRAIIRKTYPEFMQRCMHVIIDGQDYAAFGNLFLLRWVRKVQVFCHRKARLSQLNADERHALGYADVSNAASETIITTLPYEQTSAYQQEHDSWVEQILQGATVIVTPGISRGEIQMKNECLQHGYPLIHLQKEPITPFWKPEQQRFDACSHGTLLILAPYSLETMGEVRHISASSDYSQFHNLNTLASQICAFEGEARIVRG